MIPLSRTAQVVGASVATRQWRTPGELTPYLWCHAAGDCQLLDSGAGAATYSGAIGAQGAAVGSWGVSRWDDMSGNGRHLAQATQSKQPLLLAAQVGTRYGVKFDGIDDGLRVTFGSSISQPITVFVVCIKRGAANGPLLFDGLGASNRVYVGTASGNWVFNTSTANAAFGARTVGAVASMVACFNGASSQARLGRGSTTTTTLAAQTVAGLNLGIDQGGTLPFDATVAEFAVWNSTLTTTQWDQLWTYAKLVYGAA